MTTIQDRIEKLVKDIMQCGFDVAIGGDVFKSEEENKKIQEEKYNECVAVFSHKILSSIKEVEEETRKEIEFGCKKLIDNSSVRASILECSQDGYEFGIEDVIKNLSITNKEKQK